jgi:hypothetical protein
VREKQADVLGTPASFFFLPSKAPESRMAIAFAPLPKRFERKRTRGAETCQAGDSWILMAIPAQSGF